MPIMSFVLVGLFAASLGAQTGNATGQTAAACGITGQCPATLKTLLKWYLAGNRAQAFLDAIGEPKDDATLGVAWLRRNCKGPTSKPTDCTPSPHRGDCGRACVADFAQYKWGDAEPKPAKMVLGANPMIDQISPTQLPTWGVVLARIDYVGGKRDAHYRIGNQSKRLWGMLDFWPDEKIRRFYLVADWVRDAEDKPVQTKDLAMWQLVAVRGERLVVLRSGYWQACPIEHTHSDVPDTISIAFISCKGLYDALELSRNPDIQKTFGIDPAARDARATTISLLMKGTPPPSEKTIRARVGPERIAALNSQFRTANPVPPSVKYDAEKALRARLLQAFEDNLDGPFWFRCGIGCCTTGL